MLGSQAGRLDGAAEDLFAGLLQRHELIISGVKNIEHRHIHARPDTRPVFMLDFIATGSTECCKSNLAHYAQCAPRVSAAACNLNIASPAAGVSM